MNGLEVAVVGMSCKFPSADSISEFWNNLIMAHESITSAKNSFTKLDNNKSYYVNVKGALNDIARFDSDFFGFQEDEAKKIDPQLRILLEVSWEAFEDAGYEFADKSISTGVYVTTSSSFDWRHKLINETKLTSLERYKLAYITEEHYYSTQISYRFNLTGPSFTLSSACSSSLVALHIACRSLFTGECDVALVGSTSVGPLYESGYYYDPESIYSSDGHCRAFDEMANGTVPGDGAGAVILKMLDKAIEDKDHIYAVILSSAINNDGNGKISYASPGVEGLASVIRNAYDLAEVNPEDVCFIEAHGTGTKMGDALEIDALRRALDIPRKCFCAVGSVKPNIGYLDSASGMASFIKAVLSVKNRRYPPTINFKSPNIHMNISESPFYFNTDVVEFYQDKELIAGVNSYGDGGTNAHIVLMEAPDCGKENVDEDNSLRLVTFSATNLASLKRNIEKIKQFLVEYDNSFTNAIYTINIGRKDFSYRGYILCCDKSDLIEKIQNWEIRLNNEVDVAAILQLGQEEIAEQYYQDIRESRQSREKKLECIAELWLKGHIIQWNKIYEKHYNKVPMPTYSFG